MQLMNIIDNVRLEHDLSQEAFANRIGITTNTYSRQKLGKKSVRLDSLRLYAKFAIEQSESEMLKAIGEYALGVSIRTIKVE